MKDLKPRSGGIRADCYMMWYIRWPYKMEAYFYFGPQKGAEALAKKYRNKWPYPAKITLVNRAKL